MIYVNTSGNMQKDHLADLVLLHCGREQRSRMNHKIERREEVGLASFYPKGVQVHPNRLQEIVRFNSQLNTQVFHGILSSQLIYPQFQVCIWKTRTARTLFFRHALRTKHRDQFDMLQYYVYVN